VCNSCSEQKGEWESEEKSVNQSFSIPHFSYLVNKSMDANELKQRYTSGERHFPAVNLSKARLIGAYLPGINLWGADLSRANLAKAKLWGADLSRANLAKANLTRANLSGVKLNEANLRGAKLNNAKLYGANLSGACYDDSTRFSRGFDPISQNMRKF
jgi:uncharacterized protein YjbI with pentapeptide repeats